MSNLNFACKIGFIVDIQDPQNRGWVQVRVPMIHDGLAEDLLPWARVINMGGGSYDSGGQLPFEKGSSVAIIFEDGNVFKPMILGGLPKKVAEYQEYESSSEDEGSWKPTDGSRPVDMETDSPYESKEAVGTFNVWKSPKGHTIVISENPEGEFLKIIDRSGQIFEMNSPVKLEENIGNKAQRGNQNAVDGTALPYSKMSGASWIRILDLSGNEVYMYSEDDEETVLIKNSVWNNFMRLDKTGLLFSILGGQSAGGMDLEITLEGMKLNGKYLVTESLITWLDDFKEAIALSLKPGEPEPLHPVALADFLAHKDVTINSDGLKTKLI
jgi:hypothetical protein